MSGSSVSHLSFEMNMSSTNSEMVWPI